MSKVLDPFRFLLITVAGWMNEQQRLTIEYLREENRVLREQLGDRRLRFNDEQRIRLAAKAKGLKRKLLLEMRTIVTPDTLRAWHRKLIAHRNTTVMPNVRLDAHARRRRRPIWFSVWRAKIALGVTGGFREHFPI